MPNRFQKGFICPDCKTEISVSIDFSKINKEKNKSWSPLRDIYCFWCFRKIGTIDSLIRKENISHKFALDTDVKILGPGGVIIDRITETLEYFSSNTIFEVVARIKGVNPVLPKSLEVVDQDGKIKEKAFKK